MLTRILLTTAMLGVWLAFTSQHANAGGGGGGFAAGLSGAYDGYQDAQSRELANQMLQQQIEAQALMNELRRLQIENEMLKRQNGLPPASSPTKKNSVR
jgi:hypothetical protein